MSSGRRAHYADFVRVDTPLGRVAAHKAHGLFGISKRNLVLSLRQTIFEHHVCNALVVEPLRHIVSFVSRGLPNIAPAGAYHNCLAVGLLGFVYCDAGILVKSLSLIIAPIVSGVALAGASFSHSSICTLLS